MNNTTTTKVAKPRRGSLALPPKKKPYSRRALAAEVQRLTGEVYDPGYLADIANGNRHVAKLEPAIAAAIKNLAAETAATAS